MWGRGWEYESTGKDLERHIPNIYSQNMYVVFKATEEENDVIIKKICKRKKPYPQQTQISVSI